MQLQKSTTKQHTLTLLGKHKPPKLKTEQNLGEKKNLKV